MQKLGALKEDTRPFDISLTEDDEWHKKHWLGSCCIKGLSDDEIPTTDAQLEEGIDAHDVLVAFQKLFLSKMHPDPPVDAMLGERLEGTFFQQRPNNQHPSAVDPLGPVGPVPDCHEPELTNGVQRHAHNTYCQQNQANGGALNEGANDNGAPAPPHPQPRPGRRTAAEISNDGTPKACRFGFPIEASAVTTLVVKQTYSKKILLVLSQRRQRQQHQYP